MLYFYLSTPINERKRRFIMENRIVIYQIINGEKTPIPERTPQEKIENACAERVGRVHFTSFKESEEYERKSKEEKFFKRRKIKGYREDCGLLIEEATTLLGISKSYLVKIESGAKDPTLELALKIAKFYKTTVEELFC